jgi:hypothetical protein
MQFGRRKAGGCRGGDAFVCIVLFFIRPFRKMNAGLKALDIKNNPLYLLEIIKPA